jgi:hypothetical protein
VWDHDAVAVGNRADRERSGAVPVRWLCGAVTAAVALLCGARVATRAEGRRPEARLFHPCFCASGSPEANPSGRRWSDVVHPNRALPSHTRGTSPRGRVSAGTRRSVASPTVRISMATACGVSRLHSVRSSCTSSSAEVGGTVTTSSYSREGHRAGPPLQSLYDRLIPKTVVLNVLRGVSWGVVAEPTGDGSSRPTGVNGRRLLVRLTAGIPVLRLGTQSHRRPPQRSTH